MNVYLLPHHRFDPRFRYTLERESITGADGAATVPTPAGFWRRTWQRLRHWYRRLKIDYDQVVHGHEQIRLSRLVLMMDRDPSLTLVVPAGMSRESALVAIHGVIRSGLMALRSHAFRNVITALVMAVALFGATPTHFAAVVFYPLIALYAWGRYWEDRLIRRTMNHLLEVELANGREHFREEPHLAYLEESFLKTPKPDAAYREAVKYLDSLDHHMDGQAAPEHVLMYTYYSDIGRLDPYERYQDRIRKKLMETARLVVRHLWDFWKATFRWSLSMTRIAGLRFPNILFVLVGALAAAYAGIWIFSWRTKTAQAFPKVVHAVVDFSGYSTITIEAKRDSSERNPQDSDDGSLPTQLKAFNVICPIDEARVDLWPIISKMIGDHEKRRKGKIACPVESGHSAEYDISIEF